MAYGSSSPPPRFTDSSSMVKRSLDTAISLLVFATGDGRGPQTFSYYDLTLHAEIFLRKEIDLATQESRSEILVGGQVVFSSTYFLRDRSSLSYTPNSLSADESWVRSVLYADRFNSLMGSRNLL